MEKILVLDFGGQYNRLIARHVREMNVYSEIIPYNKTSVADIAASGCKGIIFTGGPNSVYGENSPHFDSEILNAGIPVLGICYGCQLIAYMAGGEIRSAGGISEYGKTQLTVKKNSLFTVVPEQSVCWMSHTDYVKSGDWTAEDFVNSSVEKYKKELAGKKVLCALSGGVDSSVAAVLLHKAIGSNLICVFVDHGLLRKDEGDTVERVMKNEMGLNLIRVNAQKRFLERLKGVSEPEKKRKIIGEEFIRVFEDVAKHIGRVDVLVQGTIYPDVIESGTGDAAVIKSHHNVGGLPDIKE